MPLGIGTGMGMSCDMSMDILSRGVGLDFVFFEESGFEAGMLIPGMPAIESGFFGGCLGFC